MRGRAHSPCAAGRGTAARENTLASIFGDLANFLGYLLTGVLVICVFIALYVRITPYHEIALIREGNMAAAVSLSGTLIGFVLPVAAAIMHSPSLYELGLSASVACLVQLAAYAGVKLLLPHLGEDIPHGRTASAVLLAAVSLGVGILNAACVAP